MHTSSYKKKNDTNKIILHKAVLFSEWAGSAYMRNIVAMGNIGSMQMAFILSERPA
jgi:hypothetical protein